MNNETQERLLGGTVATPIGSLIVVYSTEGLRLVEFETPGPRLQVFLKHHQYRRVTNKTFHSTTPYPKAIESYFAGDFNSFEVLEQHLFGTSFRKKVWKAMQSIPAGKTFTYAEIATKIGHKGAARAVGHASKLNPLGVIIPCHRVMGSGNKLVGYGGYQEGLDRKERLLRHEGVIF